MVITLDLIFVDGSTPVVLKQRNIPFRIPQGIDIEIQWNVKRSNGAVQNITGWSGFEFTLKGDTDDGIGTEIISTTGIVSVAALGTGKFFILPSQTVTATVPELLPRSGPCVADVVAIRPGGFRERLLATTDVQLGPPVALPGSSPTVSSVAATLVAGAIPARTVALVNVTTLSGPQTVNGVALVADDLVLLSAQTVASFNGVWLVKSGTWERPGSFPSAFHARQVLVSVGEGASLTSGVDQLWICTTNGPTDVIDTNDLAFSQVAGGATCEPIIDVFAQAARPSPGADGETPVTPRMILNLTSNQIEISDGSNWYSPDGVVI